MMVDKHTLEGLDACRPGSDDLAQPELADVAAQAAGDAHLARLHRKLQAFDEQVGTAMHSIAVPAGLADRVLARLPEAARLPEVAGESPANSEGANTPAVIPVAEGASLLRRTLLVASGAAALAAAVLIATWLGLLQAESEPLTAANLDASAIAWHEQLSPEWRANAAPQAYPVSTRMLPRARGWQNFSCPADRAAVAYDLTPPGVAHRVTLMVVRSKEPKLAGSPPSRPPVSTQGRLVASWREGDLIYVLVIEGPDRLDGLYRRYLELKTGTIA